MTFLLKKMTFKPVELSLIAYLLITLIPGVLVLHYTNSGYFTFFTHLFIIILIFGVALQSRAIKDGNKWYRALRLFYPLALLGFLYTETDFLNNHFFKQNLDPFFATFEGWLFGLQPSLEFSKQIPSNVFAEAMYFGYFAYYLMIIGLPLYWYFKNGFYYAEEAVFIIIQSFLIFYLFFDIIPVAGPQFYFSDNGPLPQGFLFGNLIRFIQQTGEAPTAAFPSSHVALCLIIIYMAKMESVKLFRWLLPIALLLIFSTVYIRAHYVIDILGSFITAPIVYLLSLSLFQKLKSRL